MILCLLLTQKIKLFVNSKREMGALWFMMYRLVTGIPYWTSSVFKGFPGTQLRCVNNMLKKSALSFCKDLDLFLTESIKTLTFLRDIRGIEPNKVQSA